MAQANTIPLGKPGIASFESTTYGNFAEMLFGDTPPVATTAKRVTFAGATDWPLLQAVNIADDGAITKAVFDAEDGSNMTHLLACPVTLAAGATIDVPVIEAGHFTMQAVTFEATFDSDAKKTAKSPLAPMILISKRKYTDDAISV